MSTFYDTETIYNDWAIKVGLIDPGPELKIFKRELWNKISQEAKEVFKVIVQTPEEIYQSVGTCRKGNDGEEINRVGKHMVYKYIRNRYHCPIRKSQKIFNEMIHYATSALSEEKVYFKIT